MRTLLDRQDGRPAARRRRRLTLLVTVVGILAPACGGTTDPAQRTGGTPTPSTPAPAGTPRVVSVGVSPTVATLAVGATATLLAAVSVENGAPATVGWRSSDPTRAIVVPDAPGRATVTGVGVGPVTVSVRSTADTTKEARADLTVTARAPNRRPMP